MVQYENNPWKKVVIGSVVGFVIVIIILIAFNVFPMSKNQEGTSAKKEFSQYSEALVQKAQNGDAEAQYSLGNCYFYGFGVAKDQREAVKWLRKAAEQGFTAAQNDLGHCYYSGAGVERNTDEAHKWWRMAAESDK